MTRAPGCVLPPRDKFFGFPFDVVAQLVEQFLIRLALAKQRPQPREIAYSECPVARQQLVYSYLRATTGSTRIALRAGM